MSKQPEAKFRDHMMAQLHDVPNSWWLRIELPYLRGVPDVIGCVCGHFVAIEAKRSASSKPTKLQTYVLNLIAEAGGTAVIAYPENWEKLYAEIMQYSIKQGGRNDQTDVSIN